MGLPSWLPGSVRVYWEEIKALAAHLQGEKAFKILLRLGIELTAWAHHHSQIIQTKSQLKEYRPQFLLDMVLYRQDHSLLFNLRQRSLLNKAERS